VVELLPLEKGHINSLLEVSQDREIWTHFIEHGYGKENFECYVLNAIQKREKGLEYPFVIKDKRRDQYAGITRIYEVNNELKNAKIGHTWIGKTFQGTGLNKNCKYLLFEFLFDQMQMKRIGFGASAENTHSIHAMRSVGCTQEGVLRSFMPSLDGNRRVDIVLMSILSGEWNDHVKAELREKLKTKKRIPLPRDPLLFSQQKINKLVDS